MEDKMKATVFITIFFVFTIAVHAQDSTNVANQADSISCSRYLGIYKAYPILSKSKKEKLNQKRIEITEEIVKTKQILSVKIEADTISVPKHTTILGGLINIPKLTDKQEQAVKHKKQIYKLKERLSKLEMKLKKMHALEEKDRDFYEKSLLWGIIQWEVKR